MDSNSSRPDEDSSSLHEKRWALYQEYRGRIRLQAYAVVAGLPIATLAILNSPLMKTPSAIHLLGCVLALAEIGLLFNLVVAVNGMQSVKTPKEAERLWTNSACGHCGENLALAQTVLFSVVALTEFGLYTLFVDHLPTRVILWLLLFIPTALYVWISHRSALKGRQNKERIHVWRILGVVLTTVILTVVIWASYSCRPIRQFRDAVEHVMLDESSQSQEE